MDGVHYLTTDPAFFPDVDDVTVPRNDLMTAGSEDTRQRPGKVYLYSRRLYSTRFGFSNIFKHWGVIVAFESGSTTLWFDGITQPDANIFASELVVYV